MKAAGGPERFPFEEALGLGIALLRLTPDAFWALSPREFFCALRALLGEGGHTPAPERSTLEAMMARFPDFSAERSEHV
ncbi:MAG: phage tail assembly chaperone [Proteobacteria bacterium]|nr:phage tail assembly chaperone [Pseudomonadota bacterium]